MIIVLLIRECFFHDDFIFFITSKEEKTSAQDYDFLKDAFKTAHFIKFVLPEAIKAHPYFSKSKKHTDICVPFARYDARELDYLILLVILLQIHFYFFSDYCEGSPLFSGFRRERGASIIYANYDGKPVMVSFPRRMGKPLLKI